LAALLQDPGMVFWTDAELGVYLVEALRTWAVYSFYWKERGVFPTVAATPFYDLPTLIPAVRGYTVTDANIVNTIEYHLLEPPSVPWSGTDQFTLAAVTNALTRRRNQLLVETGCRVDNFSQVVAPVQIGRTVLDDNVIDVRRLAWLDATTSLYSRIEREDEWAIDAFFPTWPQNPATPYLYSVSVAPPLTVQLAPPPINAGEMDICAVRTQADLDGSGVLMNIPDDFTWIAKWGALADLLGSDGQARDPQRVQYCEQRWKEGIALARLSTSAMGVRVNDVPAALVSLYELDEYNADWQNTSGSPSILAMAGLNLMAVADVPDGVYSVSVDLLSNAPVPVADGDFIQVGREEMEAILSYAQHLASFKMGGEEFMITAPHYDRLVQLAALKNERLRANARDFNALMDKGQRREEAFEPRREPVEV